MVNGRTEYQIALAIMERLVAKQPGNGTWRKELQDMRGKLAALTSAAAPTR